MRRKYNRLGRGCGLLVICAALTFAQTAQPEPTASIAGTVLDDVTGVPIAGATVALSTSGGTYGGTFTNSAGAFVISDLPAGRYFASARKDRYTSPKVGNKAFDLAAGDRLDKIELRLVRCAVVTGRVVDENGNPVTRAGIEVMQPHYEQGTKSLRRVGQTVFTNDLGEYRAYDLRPGRYYLSARNQNRDVWLRERAGLTYPTVYYPGAQTEAEALPIELHPGEVRSGVDFQLLPVTAVSISGQVFEANGQLFEKGAWMALLPRGHGPGLPTSGAGSLSLKSGGFTIDGVLPGDYYLLAHTGDGTSLRFSRAELSVGPEDIGGLRLVLGPGTSVTGSVELPEQGAAEVNVQDIRIYLSPADPAMARRGDARSEATEEADYTLEGLIPGPYRVLAMGLPPSAYIQAIRIGEHALPDHLVDVPESGISNLVVEISLSGATVTGRTLDRDGSPLAGARVVLVPEELHRPELYKHVGTGASGAYSITGVAPGEYKLYAFDQLERGAEMDPAFMRPFAETAVEIEVEEADTKTQDLDVNRAP